MDLGGFVIECCPRSVRGSETLAYAAASLNIQIDDLVMAQNNTNLDLTAPGVWTAGKEVQIPCPGVLQAALTAACRSSVPWRRGLECLPG